jgi:hypothetical protein
VPIEDWIAQPPLASERHERLIAASPERAVELALETPAGADPIVGALLRLRGLRSARGSAESFMRANRFVTLERESREVVLGIAAPAELFPKELLQDPGGWRDWDRPNSLKAAMTWRAEPSGDGSRLITETQVEAIDESARRRFRVYWLVVGPFSALIRRRWLAQIAKAAERERSVSPGR